MSTKKFKDSLYNLMIINNVSIEKDVFDYGLSIFIDYLIFITLTILISLLLNIFNEVIIFIVFYIPIRRFIGGYHFNKHYLCTLFSILASITIPILAKNLSLQNIQLVISIIIIILFVTYKIGTIDHPNKRLTKKEISKYTKNAIVIEIIYSIIIMILFYYQKYTLSKLLLFSLIFSILGIIVGKLSLNKS